MNEFDIKAAGWDENPVNIERAASITSAILNVVPVTKEMTALEFGAGTGIAGLLLSYHVKNIVLIDTSVEMVRIIKGKIRKSNVRNIRARLFDLEKNQWTGRKFNLLTSQMVLHHIADIEDIIEKFHNLLRPGGFLALADLYKEDGSFHGEGFTGHNGFDTGWLSEILTRKGFRDISVRKCFEIKKQFTETEIKQFDVFLLAAVRI